MFLLFPSMTILQKLFKVFQNKLRRTNPFSLAASSFLSVYILHSLSLSSTLSLCLSLFYSVSLSSTLSLCLSVSLSLYLSIFLYLSLSLSFSLCLCQRSFITIGEKSDLKSLLHPPPPP